MNKQELIERIEGLKNLFGNKSEYIEIDSVIRLISELDEPQPVKVPQCVADWYEENKDDFEGNLLRCVHNITSIFDGAKLNKFEKWFLIASTKSFQTLVNMHQFGYEVEEEKRYIVKVKATKCSTKNLVFGEISGSWFFAEGKYGNVIFKHTRKELEEADFGWVFDCSGIEIEEVE